MYMDTCRYIDRYYYSTRGGRCHDQCGVHSGSPQLALHVADDVYMHMACCVLEGICNLH